MVVGVELDDPQIAGGCAAIPVSSSRFMAELRPAAAAVAGMRADAAGRAVMLLDAVAGGQAGKVVPFHRAGGSAPFAGADHVDRLDVLEHVGRSQDSADLGVRRLSQTELPDKPLRLAIRLFRQSDWQIQSLHSYIKEWHAYLPRIGCIRC